MDHPPRDVWEPREPLDEASLVRPYTLTAGRTASSVHLPLEAPIRTLRHPSAHDWPGGDVRARILGLGADGPSVAEIAARLELPLGVARVLIGDLVEQGYLRVDATLGASVSTDERRELIGRTLRGLRAL
ncbi:DUF742 domain-containing protein [Mycolicibacterium sp. 050158]|jgi:Protein of unknown function (DUF742)|uniref:DUF742 domain-containing protein n=1 Tax=Mycolicibacterium sp. 050158 TaxID=3090602 RepID=UPI00299D9195|nr:DUF742 domain-containing protein [Mycolicibacterium sp. 050158]MDX1888420.1 DUF742 domain-containing protein [Mycolicibacterium sp. 050158]